MIPEKCACVMDKYILKDVTPQLYEKKPIFIIEE